uniref:Reverse transcriptase domain-containing protein n=1 Tax=Cannabis sativa TaxID=3483 RepID=A0A803PYN7_CANSA
MDASAVSNMFQDTVQVSQDERTFALNPSEVDEPEEANQNAIKGWKWKEIDDGIIQFTFLNRNNALKVLALCPWQLPLKKRIVSDDEAEKEEMVITQLPLVYLPGIGEVAPFGNNTKAISILELQLVACPDASSEASENGTAGVRPTLEAHGRPIETEATQPHLAGTEGDCGNCELEPSHLKKDVDWPTSNCWADPMARELLMGSLTVDKYFREPTLLNPILDIEDFTVQEHLHGPRKRKASDGLIFTPPKIPTTSKQYSMQSKLVGSAHAVKGSASRRGRRGRKTPASMVEYHTPNRMGRSPKNQVNLAAMPKSFKGRQHTKSRVGRRSTLLSHWEGSSFDLTMNLDNHFVTGGFSIWGYGDLPRKVSTVAMKILSWNCRGLGNSTTVQQLTALVRQHNPEMVILSEVRLLNNKFSRTCNKLKFVGWHYVPPIGSVGGLGLCWKKGVSCNIQFASRFLIIGEISFDPPGCLWKFFGGNGSQMGGAVKRARLDHGLASLDWCILFPNAIITHLSASGSDHRPFLLDATASANCKRRSFKYENMSARIQDFLGWLKKPGQAILEELLQKVITPEEGNMLSSMPSVTEMEEAFSEMGKDKAPGPDGFPMSFYNHHWTTKIISPNQVAFVKGRHIAENAMIAREIVHSMKKRKGKGGYMLIKIDLEKAYDRMGWEFVIKMLRLLGFPNTFTEWIKTCISVSAIKLLLNGCIVRKFTPE